MSSVFDPKNQELNINSKIVVGLERISEAFKVSLWKEHKKHGLSPIQLQILTFLLFHPAKFRTISYISNEFHTTKASISESVKALEMRGFITRIKNQKDFRVSAITLTEKGSVVANEVSGFANQIEDIISIIPEPKKEIFLEIIMDVINKMFVKDVISVQRMCLTCKYHTIPDNTKDFVCVLMDKTLKSSELRVDCCNHLQGITS